MVGKLVYTCLVCLEGGRLGSHFLNAGRWILDAHVDTYLESGRCGVEFWLCNAFLDEAASLLLAPSLYLLGIFPQ